jgi:steroid delta-isomerase-like uncharacterized protein
VATVAPDLHKAMDRRYVEELDNRGNFAAIEELFAPDYVLHFPPNPPLDREGLKHAVSAFRTAFPDLHSTVEDQVAEGDLVVGRRTVRGTHQGDFQGIPPTGKHVTISAISMMRVRDSRVVQQWAILDLLGMLQQLGAVAASAWPAAPPPGPRLRSSSGSTTTSPAHNKAMVRQLFEQGFSLGDERAMDSVLAEDYVNHDLPMPAPGRAGFKQIHGLFRAGFPDIRVTIEETIAEGDQVASHGYFTGTHRGEFMGLAPTGKPIHVAYLDYWRVADGRLADNWVRMDSVGLLQQLGVLPAAAR